MRGILLPYICISNHHNAHFKHLTVLLVNCVSVKLGKKDWTPRGRTGPIGVRVPD